MGRRAASGRSGRWVPERGTATSPLLRLGIDGFAATCRWRTSLCAHPPAFRIPRRSELFERTDRLYAPAAFLENSSFSSRFIKKRRQYPVSDGIYGGEGVFVPTVTVTTASSLDAIT